MMPAEIDLRNCTASQVMEFGAGLGLAPAGAREVLAWMCRPGTRDFEGLTSITKKMRSRLADRVRLSRLEPAQVERSRDGTVKYLFRLDDGALIESVLIPGDGRHTLCLSSQCGCAMGCRFCLTAGLGFRRNLTPAEIVNQVLAVQEHMIRSGADRATPRQLIANLVFMGMGEPLANYDHLLTALSLLMDDRGLGFSERRVTVSTCGLVPRIRDLGRDIRVNLAVSLLTVDEDVRSGLMPVNRSHGVDDLLAACREYASTGKRVIFFECVLIGGLNDRLTDARRLAETVRDVPCRINLLHYNEAASLPYRSATEKRIAAFKEILHQAGLRTLVRSSRGADISAACGQLAAGVPGQNAHNIRA